MNKTVWIDIFNLFQFLPTLHVAYIPTDQTTSIDWNSFVAFDKVTTIHIKIMTFYWLHLLKFFKIKYLNFRRIPSCNSYIPTIVSYIEIKNLFYIMIFWFFDFKVLIIYYYLFVCKKYQFVFKYFQSNRTISNFHLLLDFLFIQVISE